MPKSQTKSRRVRKRPLGLSPACRSTRIAHAVRSRESMADNARVSTAWTNASTAVPDRNSGAAPLPTLADGLRRMVVKKRAPPVHHRTLGAGAFAHRTSDLQKDEPRAASLGDDLHLIVWPQMVPRRKAVEDTEAFERAVADRHVARELLDGVARLHRYDVEAQRLGGVAF